MTRKNIILGIIIFIITCIICYIIYSGRIRDDVVLLSYQSNNDNITLKVDVSSSTGYIRKMKVKAKGSNYYLSFYSTFGINNKVGSKDTFTINVPKNVNEIYFTEGNKHKLVLLKNEDNEWIQIYD